MDIVFLRHGVTEWNKENRLQGQSDIPLAPEGILGAKRAGELLKNYRFDAVYCSSLRRARQTAQLAYPQADAIPDDRLMEWCFGEIEGMVPSEYGTRFRDCWQFGVEPIPDGETIEDLIGRVGEFVEEINAEHPNGTVLVVAHGGVSAALQLYLKGEADVGNVMSLCLPNTTPVLFRNLDYHPIPLEEV